MEPRFHKATLEDLDLLVRTRIQVLLAANRLPEDTDMSAVEQASRDYYTAALADGSHAAWLVFDGDTWIGAGGVSFYRVMPTYHNPSGRKAYLMNIYTHPDYRRRGLGRRMAELLVEEARKRGVTAISLDATAMGMPLYESMGFVHMPMEMELPNA